MIKEFKRLWQSPSGHPDVFLFLSEHACAKPSDILAVLLLDQMHRWQTDRPLTVEEYLNQFPSLSADAELKSQLVLGEFQVRQKGESTPSIDEYTSRFDDIGESLRPKLEEAIFATVVSDSTNRGEQIGRYSLVRLLGRGTFGVVWLGFDTELHRQVAIKVPNTGQFKNNDDTEAYLSEARMVAKLDHPNIVPVHDVGRSDNGNVYVVSKFIEGGTLADRIHGPCFGFVESARLISACASALHHAHDKRIIHRDVKPANILIDDQSTTPYVADFGLAIREEDYIKHRGLSGTPAYMSPEQARAEGHRLDGRSDIFSLGVVLYELLTGELPFYGETPRELLREIIHEDPRSPRTIDQSIPIELERICMRSLSKDPAARYSNAAEFADELQQWSSDKEVEQSGKTTSNPSVAFDPPSKRGKGSRSRTAIGFFVACLLALVAWLGLSEILLTVPTPVGTVVVEVDQPELAGALISVDGHRKIKIETGEGKEVVEVLADQKRHTLKVTKGGFETFAKQFTVKAGGKQTIRVRLEPLKSVIQTGSEHGHSQNVAIDHNPHRQVADLLIELDGWGACMTSTEMLAFNSDIGHPEFPGERFAMISANFPPRTSIRALGKFDSVPNALSLNSVVCRDIEVTEDSIRRLPNEIVNLYLGRCQLTEAAVSRLAAFSKLQSLILYSNVHVTDSSCLTLAKLPNLRLLDVSGTSITGEGLKHLAASPKLRSLALSSKIPVGDYTHLRSFPSLRSLFLGNPQTAEGLVEQLGALKSLRLIHMPNLELSDAKLKQLKDLLPDCSIVHPRIPTEEADRKAAQWAIENGGIISISDRGFHETQLDVIPERSFALRAIRVPGKPSGATSVLTGLRNLETLFWLEMSSDWELVPLTQLRSLRTLHIGYSELSADGIRHLKSLNQLEELSLKSCLNMTDAALQHVRELSNLRTLVLAHCPQITDDGLKNLIALKELRQLELNNTAITDAGISSLQQMKTLRILKVHGTHISAKGAKSLQGALPDCVVFHESLEEVHWRPAIAVNEQTEH